MRMFFAREEMPRLNAHKNPPSRVVTRQPNLLTRAPDACPEKKISAIESEPTQAKRKHTNVTITEKSAVTSMFLPLLNHTLFQPN